MLKKIAIKKTLKPLAFAGLGLLGLTLALWVCGKVVAGQKTAGMDAIAQKALQQYPDTDWNNSAKTLKQLAADIGFKSITSSEEEVASDVSPGKADALDNIREDFQDYFAAQSDNRAAPLAPLPESIPAFLAENQTAFTTLQNHLISGELPVFPLEVEAMTHYEYGPLLLFTLADLQKLLLLNAVDYAQKDQPAEMAAALEASLVLPEILAQRPDIISYLISLIMMDQSMGIVRNLEGVPPEVASQLLAFDQQKIGADRLKFQNWIGYKQLQNMTEDEAIQDYGVDGGVISWLPFARTYLTLSNIDMTNTSAKAYDRLPEFNFCSTSIHGLSSQLELTTAPWWNIIGPTAQPSWLGNWQKGGEKMLAAELTYHIVQAKALAAEQGQWPETLPNLASQTCPDEQWLYTVSPEGEMSLSFSHELAWLETEQSDYFANMLPLRYQATLSD